MGLKDVFDSFKEVFGNKRYFIAALLIAVVFYLINVFINSLHQLRFFYDTNGFYESLKFFFLLAIGLERLIIPTSFITLILIGILIGILFSMIAYRTRKLKMVSKETGFLATIGIFLGVIVPGCVACGIGLISFFGFGAAFLNLLPFKGFEISVLSIVILIAAIFMISKDIKKDVACKI